MSETTMEILPTTTTTEPRTITVTKSQLAMYKGLGKSIAEIAELFTITPTEAKELLLKAGLIKGVTKTPAYTINFIDDIKK